MLVANGHRLEDVWGYSLRAIDVYMELALKRQRQALFNLTVAVRHTQGVDAKVFQQFLKDLQGED